MTLLELVQHFCKRTALPTPASVLGSTDKQIIQILTLLEEEGNDLATRHQWQGLTKEAALTTIANEDQGSINTIAATGFRYIKNNTIWDRTDRLPVIGPMNGMEWQALKAVTTTGPRYQFRILGDHLLVNPAPVAGHNWRFEYVSRNWIMDTNGTTTKEFFTADTDTVILSHSILLQGIRWRWLREKGLDYAELFNTYEMQVKDAMGRDGGAKTLYADGEGMQVRPGIWVPSGNWFH
jgi:hypothetical protein